MTAAPYVPRPDRLVLQFTLTADDLVDGSRAYYRHRPVAGWALGIGLAAASVLGLVWTREPIWLITLAVGLVAIAHGKLRALDRVLLRANPQARVGTAYEMEFTGTGLRFDNAGIAGLVQWSAITEVRESDSAILLLQGACPMAMIPKRAFDSPADLAAAYALMSEKIRPQPMPKAKIDRSVIVSVGVLVLVVFLAGAVTAYLR